MSSADSSLEGGGTRLAKSTSVVNRVASGAAYPSDFEGGHMAAVLAVHEMLKNPAFRADYDAVKAEVRKGLGL